MSDVCASVIFNISGVVQGVGFRPFVSRIAQKYCICGRVINKGAFVEVISQGEVEMLEKFTTEISAIRQLARRAKDAGESILEHLDILFAPGFLRRPNIFYDYKHQKH